MNELTNIVSLSGEIVSEPVLHTTPNGAMSYLMLLESVRPNGVKDMIELQVPIALFLDEEYRGRKVRLKGELRSFYSSEKTDKGNRFTIYRVLVRRIEFWTEKEDENLVYLNSWVSGAPEYKVKIGMETITQLQLSVKRAGTEKIDVLYCSCWGKDAEALKCIRVGSSLKVTGRLCSRPYKKQSNQEAVTHSLYVSMFDYEVSEQKE